MTYDQLRQYIDAAERGELEANAGLKTEWIKVTSIRDLGYLLSYNYELRITPKPVWRAWETVDEVPVGAWVKWNHLTDELSRICSAELTDVGLLVQCGEDKEVGADMLFHNAQLTTDLKTFTPCGVEVKG